MKTLKKRRLRRKTNYAKRLKILTGEKPRIVFRKTNRYLICQYVESKESQDKIKFGVDSKILIKYDWPQKASLKSISAAYFLGLFVGLKIKNEKLSTPILDVGMMRAVHKTKIYGFLKGLIDAGIKMKYKKEIFPEEGRIKGEHLKNKIPFEKIKSKIVGGK